LINSANLQSSDNPSISSDQSLKPKKEKIIEEKRKSLDEVNIWTLRIQDPVIQANYRKYQREKIRDDYRLVVTTFLLLSIISLTYYLYLMFLDKEQKTDYEQKKQAAFQHLMSSVSGLLIIICGILISRKWLFCTELI
jgi:anaerobic C4-dicarboxylate transporter